MIPYPSWSVNPGDTPAASKWNQLGANDDALANGTGFSLNNNVIPANALATNAITIGYAQIIANATNGSATPTLATGLTAAVTIPAGGRRIKITVFTTNLTNSNAGQQALMALWDGTVGGTQLSAVNTYASVANVGSPSTLVWSGTPSAGAKTYNVSISSPFAGGTAAINCAATAPAFILVEVI